MGRKDTGDRGCFLAGAMMAVAAAALLMAARKVPGFGSWYAVTVYPWLVSVFGRFWGIFPWSVSEWGIYGLAVASLVYGARHIRRPGRLLSRLWAVASGLLLLYALNCGVNYYRTPFSHYLGLKVEGHTEEELYGLCEELTRQVNLAVREIGPGEAAAGVIGNSEEELEGYQEACVSAMEGIGGTYPQLAGYYPRPKPVTVSRILSVQQLCGIYSPFTIEANYNREMTGYGIPHTICHELSHLRGFMREDEANFIGYLACIRSEDPALRYSGYLTGWYYAMSALSREDPEGFSQLWERLDPAAIGDIQADVGFWRQYDGKVAEAAANVNNSYLKMNDQSEGIHTYGRMVDLMLAYFYAE